MVEPDRDQAALTRLLQAAPSSWDEADRHLFATVGRHVQARTDAGDFPPSAPDPTALTGPLYRFLLGHRALKDSTHARLSGWLAAACMGGHHLWEDLGLSGRPQVSRLMQLAFPVLHDSNVMNLRWKRHLFLCLGDTLGRPGLRPAKCDDCGDFAVCMGAGQAPMQTAIRIQTIQTQGK